MRLVRIFIKRNIAWKGEHPIATGAYKADFSADIQYTVKPLLQPFADILNQYTNGFAEWKIGGVQDILGKEFLPFGLKEGQIFKEYDLMYVLMIYYFEVLGMLLDAVLIWKKIGPQTYKFR